MIIQDLGTKKVKGVDVATTVEQDGSIFVRALAQSCEHRVTIGASDGQDALASLSPKEMADALQSAVDAARDKVATLVNTRAAVLDALKKVS